MTSRSILKDENGLILPRKIKNPCLESLPVKNLQREMKWNSKKGINVLDNKSELEKAVEKHRKTSEQKVKEAENKIGTEFENMLAERALRIVKFEAEKNTPTNGEENLFSQLKCVSDDDQSQPSRKNKLTDVSSQTNVTSARNNRNNKTARKSKLESETGDEESEFARVFAQLRGEKRWD
eukprot:GFUD01057911.1.p1 GENE.GFUD01057911.1~~GFUD01057911.1.p1  ORF type:complete len:193 (+),score=66.06 GFUD01057911.1:42-581(+)